MEKRSRLSKVSVISWVSAVEGCPLSGVPVYILASLRCSLTSTKDSQDIGLSPRFTVIVHVSGPLKPCERHGQ